MTKRRTSRPKPAPEPTPPEDKTPQPEPDSEPNITPVSASHDASLDPAVDDALVLTRHRATSIINELPDLAELDSWAAIEHLQNAATASERSFVVIDDYMRMLRQQDYIEGSTLYDMVIGLLMCTEHLAALMLNWAVAKVYINTREMPDFDL